ncbi:MAG: cobalamin B12-binding domain-containing protein [Pseudomonadota bacterium]
MSVVGGKKIRILVAKPGVDGHDRGAVILCQAFRDAGWEVIYTGLWQTADMIVNAAIAEDVDVIALSSMGNTHLFYFPEVMRLLKERKAEDMCVVGGGIIPEEDKPQLEKVGVTGNFGPGTPVGVIIDHIVERVERRRS